MPDKMPSFGFGTSPLKGEAAQAAVEIALETGYRHIDTAQMYLNEDQVGDACAASGLPRNDLFIVTKVHPENFANGNCIPSARQSLDRLKLDRVDLLLAHWPPRNMAIEKVIDELLAAHDAGICAAIGVSNFTSQLLETAVRHSPIPITTNQVELHPLIDRSDLHAKARHLGVTLTAYSPNARGRVSDSPEIITIAERLGRSPSQIALRWIIQQGAVPIPNSGSRPHIEANFAALDFTLSDSDMDQLTALSRQNLRVGRVPPSVDDPGL